MASQRLGQNPRMSFAGRNGLAAGSMSSLLVRAPNVYHCLSCPEALPAAIAQVRHFIFTTLPVQSTAAELEASRLLAHPRLGAASGLRVVVLAAEDEDKRICIDRDANP